MKKKRKKKKKRRKKKRRRKKKKRRKRKRKRKKKTKDAKVLGEECSQSEYIYYKETDRNFCGEARLSFWKRKVRNGVNGWGLKMLKKKVDISE
jgi:hypothetical protein